MVSISSMEHLAQSAFNGLKGLSKRVVNESGTVIKTASDTVTLSTNVKTDGGNVLFKNMLSRFRTQIRDNAKKCIKKPETITQRVKSFFGLAPKDTSYEPVKPLLTKISSKNKSTGYNKFKERLGIGPDVEDGVFSFTTKKGEKFDVKYSKKFIDRQNVETFELSNGAKLEYKSKSLFMGRNELTEKSAKSANKNINYKVSCEYDTGYKDVGIVEKRIDLSNKKDDYMCVIERYNGNGENFETFVYDSFRHGKQNKIGRKRANINKIGDINMYRINPGFTVGKEYATKGKKYLSPKKMPSDSEIDESLRIYEPLGFSVSLG